MSISPIEVEQLTQKASVMRHSIVNMMGPNKAHHFGGSLSVVEILTALYFYKMNYAAEDPKWPDRDRLILSKGHAVPAQYAALALMGVLPIEELGTLKKMGTRLQGHPVMHLTPGIEACGGALGEGLSYANGISLASRILGKTFRVYCVLGDGELQEGQVWEAAMTAAHHKLSNLTAVIDINGLKAMDKPQESKYMGRMRERWESFGWCAAEVDGHDLKTLCDALDWATSQQQGPVIILAHTIKGKGISFIEGQPQFHNASLDEEQIKRALSETDLPLQMGDNA
jgi:transketolase